MRTQLLLTFAVCFYLLGVAFLSPPFCPPQVVFALVLVAWLCNSLSAIACMNFTAGVYSYKSVPMLCISVLPMQLKHLCSKQHKAD